VHNRVSKWLISGISKLGMMNEMSERGGAITVSPPPTPSRLTAAAPRSLRIIISIHLICRARESAAIFDPIIMACRSRPCRIPSPHTDSHSSDLLMGKPTTGSVMIALARPIHTYVPAPVGAVQPPPVRVSLGTSEHAMIVFHDHDKLCFFF
jgi:hypothetical protein